MGINSYFVAAGSAQKLIDELSAEAKIYRVMNGEPIGIRSLATLASLILFENRPLLIAHLLIGGIDREGGSLYSIDWLGTVTEERYTASGSGTSFAISIIESEYRRDMGEEEAVKLAVKAVRAAMMRDPGSGEGVDVALVSRKGVRLLRGEEVLG